MKKYLELQDFIFSDRFEGLTEVQFHKALQMVNAQFSGVYDLWSFLPPTESRAKRELCINYLMGWQLMTLYPDSAINSSGSGGMPLSSKKVGPVFIKYRDTINASSSGMLDMLTTNEYGLQALTMIQSAPENWVFKRQSFELGLDKR